MQVRQVKFELREGTAAEWLAVDPVLRRGEPGFERDTNQLKVGDGSSHWSTLPYLTGGSGGSVISVFGRMGVVTAQSGDYTKAQVGLGNVDNTSDLAKPVGTATQAALDTKAPIDNPTFTGTVAGVTKSMVGLGNVDNTADLDKPVSTATTAALAGKSNTGHTHGAADIASGTIAVARLPVGTTAGTVAAGDDSRFASSPGNPYPLEGYGFHSASVPIETARTDSTHGNVWAARVWVPAGKAINTIGLFVSQTGATGSGNNAFAIYDDDGNFVASTPTDNNLWVADHAWVLKNLSSPIAAQSSGRFVYVVSSRQGGTDPMIAYLQIGFGEKMMSGGPSGKFRSFIPSGSFGSSFPSTINVVTPGTNFSYLPLYVLA